MTTTQRVHGKGRGFASMDEETRRRIASLGGKRAHELGTAHTFTPEEAQAAGRIGGTRSRRGANKPKAEQE
jgi:general stress protein YciG